MEETFSRMFIIQGFFCLLFLTIWTVRSQHLYRSLLSKTHPQASLFSSTISNLYLIMFKCFRGASVSVFWLDSACFTLVMATVLSYICSVIKPDECALCLHVSSFEGHFEDFCQYLKCNGLCALYFDVWDSWKMGIIAYRLTLPQIRDKRVFGEGKSMFHFFTQFSSLVHVLKCK